jgi:hypothetical protein
VVTFGVALWGDRKSGLDGGNVWNVLDFGHVWGGRGERTSLAS